MKFMFFEIFKLAKILKIKSQQILVFKKVTYNVGEFFEMLTFDGNKKFHFENTRVGTGFTATSNLPRMASFVDVI